MSNLDLIYTKYYKYILEDNNTSSTKQFNWGNTIYSGILRMYLGVPGNDFAVDLLVTLNTGSGIKNTILAQNGSFNVSSISYSSSSTIITIVTNRESAMKLTIFRLMM